MTSFSQLRFFHADINQSEVEDSFQLASDWVKSVRNNVNNSKVVTVNLISFIIAYPFEYNVVCLPVFKRLTLSNKICS